MTIENLYFIAIKLPQHIQSKVIDIQTDISERFGSKAALKVMPHITLKAPFKISVGERLEVIEWFNSMILDTEPFELELQNFESFANPKHPVIYIKPVANPLLMDLQKSILQNFINAFPAVDLMNLELEFKPHLTVAYRDLKPEMFHKAWLEFVNKIFSTTFNVGEIHLLQHDGKIWNIIQTHNLL